MSTVKPSPLPRLTTWIMRCSTLSWSVIVHISDISLIKALFTFVGNIVADSDWFPLSSALIVAVSCAGYCLPVKSVTYKYPLYFDVGVVKFVRILGDKKYFSNKIPPFLQNKKHLVCDA